MSPQSKRNAFEAGIAALTSLVLSLVVFASLLGRLASGWAGGDLLSTYVNAEMWSGLSYRVTDQMGYPLGMNLNFFPGVDITENLFAQLATAVTGEPFVGINLLIWLSFPIVAALAYAAIRMTGLQGPLAIALAVAFSLIPYHWGRALGHMYLSTIYSVVTGMLLVLLVGSGQLPARLTTGTRRRRAGQWGLLAALIVITAWTGVYYAAFTVILCLAALAWRFVRGDAPRALLLGTVPPVAVLGVAFLGFLPGILAKGGEQPLAVLSERMPYESVLFAGVLVAALLPLPMGVLPGMGFYNRNILEAVGAAPPFENVTATNFGTVVTTACLLLFLGTVAWRARRRRNPDADERTGITAGLIGMLMGVTVLFFVPWGLNYLMAGLVTAQIRAWNRLLPFLLLLFVLGAAVVLRRMRWAWDPVLGAVVGMLVVLLTAVESVLPFRVPYATSVEQHAATTDAGRAYATEVNAVLPAGCGILQLPYFAYPEHGVVQGKMADYDHFWTSLLNPQQRWSYGAVKNTRASIWAAQLPQTPTDEQLLRLQEAGFCAIHLDTAGYDKQVAELVQWDLGKRLGPAVATGADGRWQLFALPSPQPLPARDSWSPELVRFLLPPFVQTPPESMSVRYAELTTTWQWLTHPSSTVTITPIDDDVPLRGIRGQVHATECADAEITLTLTADGQEPQTHVLASTKDGEPQDFAFELPSPTGAPATLTIDAPEEGCLIAGDPARKYAKVLDLTPLT